MSKYNYPKYNYPTGPDHSTPFIKAIANELAEANRLKRLELTYADAEHPIPDDELEDKA